MTKHQFYNDNDFKNHIHDQWFQTNIIDGGLSLCKICGGLEGGLTTDCPGEKVSNVIQDDVYFGRMDYINGKWLVGALNPTNKMWLYGRYIKYKDYDEQFAVENKISYEYFMQIKDEWIDRGFKLKL